VKRALSLLLALLLLTGCNASPPEAPSPSESTAPPSRPASPAAAAEELSERFGVTVRIGPPSEMPKGYLAEEAPSEMLDRGLAAMEQALARYADGFLAALGEKAGGLTYCLTGDLYSIDGGKVGGLFCPTDEGLSICLDLRRPLLTVAVHHETSHAIEHLLRGILPPSHPLFADWGPGGYLNSYDGYEGMTAFTDGFERDEERILFLDTYSKTFPAEDRAQLLACYMEDESSPALACKHLKSKLQRYLSSIEQALGLSPRSAPALTAASP